MKKPDWKKVEDYDYTKKLGRTGWAWEFLRRNPKYRKDYESHQKGHFKDVTYEPPKQPGETNQHWMKRCALEEDVVPRTIRPEQTLAWKWGLKYSLYDPSFNALELAEKGTPVKIKTDVEPIIIKKWDDVSAVPVEELPVRIGDKDGADVITAIRRDRLLVLLDVTGPIKPQLDVVRHHFKQAKAELPPEAKKGFSGKPKASVFLKGIRALDGREAKVSKIKIGKILFVKEQEADIGVKIHDCIESAIKNREFGYKAIARRRTPLLKT